MSDKNRSSKKKIFTDVAGNIILPPPYPHENRCHRISGETAKSTMMKNRSATGSHPREDCIFNRGS
jgi:hypothetical protein